MESLPHTRPGGKVITRTATLTARVGTDGPDGRVLLTVGKAAFGYWITPAPTDIPGRAFRVTRFGHTEADADGDYQVLIGTNPADTSCECRGFAYHAHCKHSAGLASLIAAGEL
jgi:hypothetical protein